MPGLVLPIFPHGVTRINSQLAFSKDDNNVYYFYGGMNPIFVHAADDIASFRMIVSQFYVTGKVTQSEICKAFGIPLITMKRNAKLYREKGPAGFYQPSKRGEKKPHVLTPEVILEAEKLLACGLNDMAVCNKLNIKRDTFYRACKTGKIKKN